jgi:imidazoleglycerol-phosphate dehydratase
MTRIASKHRKSKETDIKVELNLDGLGLGEIDTGVPFLDHMLEQFRKHAFIDLSVSCKGDNQIDDHHSVEDVAIVLGLVIKEALGDRSSIARYGSFRVPMDETLVSVDLDLASRPFLVYDVAVPKERINTFETELCIEFWRALVNNAEICLHFHKITGSNSHHIIEASFKAFAKAFALAKATETRYQGMSSTKGLL